MHDVFSLTDRLGPAKIIHIAEPAVDLRGTLVIDNTILGPTIGGLRIGGSLDIATCTQLARATTLKFALAGLPYGGSKAVIHVDAKPDKVRKESLIRAFAAALQNEHEYMFAPDMGTDEVSMAWVKDEIGRSVGLPKDLGGIPLDQIGATGWGLSHATDVALQYRYFKLEDAKVAIQGFGAVGSHCARFLSENGAIIVAVADSRGMTYCPHGLDMSLLSEFVSSGASVREYPDGEPHESGAIIDVKCDIFIPAATPHVINEHNVDRLHAKLVVQGGDIPVTDKAEARLAERGVLSIPDFVGNAGGAICMALERQGATQSAAMAAIKERIRRNVERILETAQSEGITPRDAALRIALRRLEQAKSYRRWSLSAPSARFS